MVNYKVVKIPEEDYNAIERARQELAMKGVETLPQDFIHSTRCPLCGSRMEGISVKVAYLQCSNPECGYKQRSLKINATGAFALGALMGLGAAALIYLMSKNKKEKNS